MKYQLFCISIIGNYSVIFLWYKNPPDRIENILSTWCDVHFGFALFSLVYNFVDLIKIKQTKATFIEKNDIKLENFYKSGC